MFNKMAQECIFWSGLSATFVERSGRLMFKQHSTNFVLNLNVNFWEDCYNWQSCLWTLLKTGDTQWLAGEQSEAHGRVL